jgi:hypothetical protein
MPLLSGGFLGEVLVFIGVRKIPGGKSMAKSVIVYTQPG